MHSVHISIEISSALLELTHRLDKGIFVGTPDIKPLWTEQGRTLTTLLEQSTPFIHFINALFEKQPTIAHIQYREMLERANTDDAATLLAIAAPRLKGWHESNPKQARMTFEAMLSKDQTPNTPLFAYAWLFKDNGSKADELAKTAFIRCATNTSRTIHPFKNGYLCIHFAVLANPDGGHTLVIQNPDKNFSPLILDSGRAETLDDFTDRMNQETTAAPIRTRAVIEITQQFERRYLKMLSTL